jgi:hypothetical protein
MLTERLSAGLIDQLVSGTAPCRGQCCSGVDEASQNTLLSDPEDITRFNGH